VAESAGRPADLVPVLPAVRWAAVIASLICDLPPEDVPGHMDYVADGLRDLVMIVDCLDYLSGRRDGIEEFLYQLGDAHDEARRIAQELRDDPVAPE